MLATLGWEGVVHDTTDRVEGRLAAHQLDVTARHPSGEIKRLIVECKDWDAVVGQDTLDHLVGVLAQIEADAAAVMTTKGYTDGALKVAVDEEIALLRLKAFDPENPTPYVKKIVLNLEPVTSTFSDVDVELRPDHGLPPDTQFRWEGTGADRLVHLYGAPAETLQEVLQDQGRVSDEAGPHERRVTFADGRLLTTADGGTVPISALSWTETVHRSSQTTVTEAKGEPMMVLEQLNEKGELEHGRIVVDEDLFAWDIDDDGNLIPRGPLIDGPG